MDDVEESSAHVASKATRPSPETLTKLVKRLRALTLKLLPVEVDPAQLTEPTSRFISPQVIQAYVQAAGDFTEALPYCLLRARQLYMWDANHNPADYDENFGRAIACEVLSRRILHKAPTDRHIGIMSMRYRHLSRDGEYSDMTSALELAIDTNRFHVVNCLWRGDLIQRNNENNDIEYVPFDESREYSIWDHLDPSRLTVPRSQNFFRVLIWLIFLAVYSQAVKSPLDRLDINHQFLDGWELCLYIYKTLRYFSWRAFGFWTVVSLITDVILVSAFTTRVLGIRTRDGSSGEIHYRSFQILSFVAPFIWSQGYSLQSVFRKCDALLSILGIGFAQGLYAIDAADGETEHGTLVVNALIQALLQFVQFGCPRAFQAFIDHHNLIGRLISIHRSLSKSMSVVDDAEAQYLAFFAGKTVGMIRAPDSYVYPAPFNLVEIFLIAPFELILSVKAYAKLNRRVMVVLFFVPLLLIAIWETNLDPTTNRYTKNWFLESDDCDAGEDPAIQDPEVEEDGGRTISKVPFEEIIKAFPDAKMSGETHILNDLAAMKEKLDLLIQTLGKKE
ncbi:calcium activated cation channel [Schizopora paradoxa]|uniref:Calcium activated cation channel n=1 Tax=Schizopora paradoxa TaxID=27342 RepID=A0A0H2RWC8_9AGAM|nr:calcium activated cation channel [Schizopora paradoxa]